MCAKLAYDYRISGQERYICEKRGLHSVCWEREQEGAGRFSGSGIFQAVLFNQVQDAVQNHCNDAQNQYGH